MDINEMMNAYQRLKSNPREMLASRFNIPDNVNVNNPNDILQHLLNTGQVSQDQVNKMMMMRNNPMIQKMLNNN